MKAAAKATMVVALVFIIGFLSGIGTIACFQALRFDKPWKNARFLPRQFSRYAPKHIERIEHLANELELTPEQRKKFEPVLNAGMEKIRDLRRKHRPEVREILLETRMKLRSILNKYQCIRFDELSPSMAPDRDLPGFGRRRRMKQQATR